MQYASNNNRFRATSLQLLSGIQQSLWESLISTGDAHIVGLFRSDLLTQSYGP
jgi:hypothetical protein